MFCEDVNVMLKTVRNAFWNSIEFAERRQINAIQESKLRAQLNHIYWNSPFYQKKISNSIKKVSKPEDLKHVPVTTRAELEEDVESTKDIFGGRLCTTMDKILYPISPPEFPIKRVPVGTAITYSDHAVVVEHLIRQCIMVGIKNGDTIQVQCNGWEPLNFAYFSPMFGAATPPNVGEILELNVIPLEIIVVDMARTIHTARYFQPTAVYTNKAALMFMEDIINKEKGNPKQLGYQQIIVREDKTTLSSTERKTLEDKWGAEVYSMLDVQDNLFYAMDCPEHKGLHVWEDGFIVEITEKDTGEPLEPGQKGMLTITNLFAEATPLIRYQTEVEATLTFEKCPCGRTHARIIPPNYNL